MIDLRDLEAFLSILDSGSLSKAASDLSLTQPALSLKLKKMEADLGVKLFQRTPRNLLPLDAARKIEPSAREMMSLAKSLHDSAASEVSSMQGNVKVGCLTGWFESLLISPSIKLTEKYPLLRLKLIAGNGDELVEKVARGLLDCAIVTGTYESEVELETETLISETLTLFGKDAASLAKSPNWKEQILNRKWICMSYPDPLVDQFWKNTCPGEKFPWAHVHVPIISQHIRSLPYFISEMPSGIGIVPRQILKKTTDESWIGWPGELLESHSLTLVFRKGARSVRRVSFVIETLKNYWAGAVAGNADAAPLISPEPIRMSGS
jgi:DNA-binding transcriptional LysR family regulator